MHVISCIISDCLAWSWEPRYTNELINEHGMGHCILNVKRNHSKFKFDFLVSANFQILSHL